MDQVILLSGPPGARTTAVAEAICERFDRMLHVEVDDLRRWVKAGYRRPWDGDRQADEQQALAVRNAAAIARESIAARYAVVITDVVVGAAVERYRDALADAGAPVQLVTLLPSLDAALARDAARRDAAPDLVRAVHEAIRAALDAGTLPGAVLDTTDDPDAYVTADRVQDAVSRGLAVFIRP